MDIYDAILERHSVRKYIDKKIPNDKIYAIQAEIEAINEESGMHIQYVIDDEKPFKSFTLKRIFSGVKNYIVLAGPDNEKFDEMSGYFGERLVLKLQMLGLNSCWVGLKCKAQCELSEGEKMGCVIAFGYGETQGVQHKMREMRDLCEYVNYIPKWFEQGMLAVLLAPSAMNQQKYKFILKDKDLVEAATKSGPFTAVDLGIAEYHFEIGTGDYNFKWDN